MPDAILEARALRKEYGDLVAVDDVDLAVPQGGPWGSSANPARARRPSPRCSSG